MKKQKAVVAFLAAATMAVGVVPTASAEDYKIGYLEGSWGVGDPTR